MSYSNHLNSTAVKKIGGAGLAAVMAVGSMGTGAVTALAVDDANPTTPPSTSGGETTTTSRKLQTTYGKQTVTYEKNSDGNYEATISKYDGDPLKAATATLDGEDTPIALTAETPSLNIDHGKVGVSHLTGTVTYKGTFDESATTSRKVTLTVNVDETYGKEITLKDGTPFTVQGDTDTANATLNGVTLDKDGTPSETTVSLSNGTTAAIDWSKPSYDYRNGYTVTKTGTATARVEIMDFNWDNGTRTDVYGWNTRTSVTASNTASWSTNYEGNSIPFATSDEDGKQLASMTGNTIPKQLEVTGSNGSNVTLTNPTLTPEATTGAGKLDMIHETGTAGYSKKAEGILPEFAATVNYTKDYGKEVTLKDGTPFTIQQDGKTAVLDYSNKDYTVNKAGKVVGKDGREITSLKLSDDTELPITWSKTTDAKTHATTVTGTVSQKYKTIDPETRASYEWTVQVNQSYTRTDTWSGEVGGKTFNFTNNPETGDQSYTASEPSDKVPGRITVHTNDSDDTFTLNHGDLKDVRLTANGTFAKVDVTGTAVYHVGAKNGSPAFDVSIPFRYTAGENVTLEDGTPFAVSGENADGTVEAAANTTGSYHVTKDRKVVDADGNEVKTIKLSNGRKLNVSWTVNVDNSTHVTTATGVATGNYAYTDTQTGQTKVWHMTVNLGDYSRTNTWYAQVGNDKLPFVNLPNMGGSQSLTAPTVNVRPTAVTIGSLNKDDNTQFKVEPKFTEQHITSGDKLGTAIVTGTAVYHADANPSLGLPQFDVTVPFEYSIGEEITLDNGTDKGTPFSKYEDGSYHAGYSATGLSDKDNSPSYHEVTLSNKDKATVQWESAPKTMVGADNKNNIIVLSGTATGVVTVKDEHGNKLEQSYTVGTRDIRAEDKSFTKMTLTQTSADGKSKSYEIKKEDFDENHQKTVELPASDAKDSFSLSAEHGLDAEVSRPKLGVDGTSRLITVTVNGVDYTVRVNFKTSDLQPDSPARLDGIYVNLTGKAEKGTLIDNWNPNRLDYVVALKDANTSAYLLPEAPKGVTVKAGNVTQSAQSNRQEWTVTDTATGATRTYSVTVTRPVKTAVTEFQPKEPVEQSPVKTPDSQTDTSLASVGYVGKDGKYVPVTSDKFEIPEGGVFSYETKVGQSAVASSSHKGMTYTYTVSVLSPDGVTFTQHDYTVTYITAATHKAELTGISVDGKLINGFDPDKTSYEVAVDNPDKWTVVGQYDKDSGMSITINKNGADATLTVTSGDGLVSKDYKIHATKKPFGGAGTAGVSDLAQTGVNTGIIGIVIVALLAVGGILTVAVKRLGKRNAVKRVEATPDSKTESNPEPENDSDKNNPVSKAE
ncbi:hypothetical protein [Bifidobacterium catenulatum]|uniref:Cell surface protein n=1 Tax=Bifidobacterium catenulatum subsp. kashiwanohense TaxID=630129 RepID=A0AA43P5R5_9BIFI|nr:hypothetical protein [Bifidobacterium catenulatum]MDH7889110.1 hypothetical protein [Bifidobacterium catenulatum subsp. kashiwanohense]